MNYIIYFLGLCALNIIMLFFGTNNASMLIICVSMTSAYMIVKNIERLYFILSVIFFGLAELTLVRAGIWTYSNPQLIGIPYWMPLMWGLCTAILKQVTDGFKHYSNKIRINMVD